MTWIVMLSVGLGSYMLRALPLFVGERWLASPKVERLISHAGSAALAALIATGLRRAAVTTDETVAVVLAAGTALAMTIRGGSMQRVLVAGALVYATARIAMLLV